MRPTNYTALEETITLSAAVRFAAKLLWFYLGLTMCAVGYSLVIKPAVGSGPWDVFHLGLSGQTGIPLAFIMQGVGAGVVLLDIALGIRPSLGMVLNMLSIGPIVQFTLGILPTPEALPARWAMLLVGILVAGQGTALYVSADIGSGPRDGMMIGLTRMLGRPVAFVKNGIDVAVTTGGWLLGGPVGLGTLVVALLMGPSIQFGMWVVVRLARIAPFSSFVRPVPLRRPQPQPQQVQTPA